MKKILKYSGITLSVILGLLLFISLIPFIDRAGHFDAVMVDNELYFILTDEYDVGGVVVFKSSTTTPDPALEIWSVGTLEGGNWPKTRQIKYGQKIKEFNDSEIGPKELQKNVGYFALMNTSEKVSLGTVGDFIITSDNKVIMTRYFDHKRPKKRTVIIEKNGQKITVPYSVSFDKDDRKVIVSEPVSEK
ncbi:MAG: hypothetical protein HY746_06355 [Elusimicrobia bacterium]|nr:hypothetical protein [Elusimicrobiota bacterium]